MLTSIQTIIGDFGKKYPRWDTETTKYLNDEVEVTEENKFLLTDFVRMLNAIVEQIIDKDLAVGDVIELLSDYGCYENAKRYIVDKVNVALKYQGLRELERKDAYKLRACIDLIWNNYIIRHNPYLELNETAPIEEKLYGEVAPRLDRFVDTCVKRHLTEEAICKELMKESFLTEPTCKYVAAKVETDFEKLKLNYLIDKITAYDRIIKAIKKDD